MNDYFEEKSFTGIIDNTYLIGSFHLFQIDCLIRCALTKFCLIAILNIFGNCNIYSKNAYLQLVFVDKSTAYIKKTYSYEIEFGLVNYWIGSDDGIDVISGANLYGGVNVQSVMNKYGKDNSAFFFDYGYYKVPSGVYFGGDFTVSAWVKLTRYGSSQRLIDFGNQGQNNIIIALSGKTNNSNNVMFGIIKGGNGTSITATNPIKIGIWKHVTVVLKVSIGYIYIVGVLGRFGPLHIPNNVTRNYNFIGRSNWPSTDSDVSASISNIKIFNKALNSTEVKLNMDIF